MTTAIGSDLPFAHLAMASTQVGILVVGGGSEVQRFRVQVPNCSKQLMFYFDPLVRPPIILEFGKRPSPLDDLGLVCPMSSPILIVLIRCQILTDPVIPSVIGCQILTVAQVHSHKVISWLNQIVLYRAPFRTQLGVGEWAFCVLQG